MKVLFVGGSMHGAEHDVQPRPRASTVDGADVEMPLPDKYVNVATGEQYLHEVIDAPLASLISGQVVAHFQRSMYLLDSLYGNVQHSHAALADACTRLWIAGGEHIDDAAAPPDPDEDPGVFYIADCEPCRAADVDAPGFPAGEYTFATLIDRAQWAQIHIGSTGHQPKFSTVVRSGSVAAKGGEGPAPEPSGGTE